MKRMMFKIGLILLVSGIYSVIFAEGRGYMEDRERNYRNEKDTHFEVSDYPSETVSQAEWDALEEALADEYKAKELYRAVMDRYGEYRPFSNIIKSEENHISILKSVYEKYGRTVSEPDVSADVSRILEDIHSMEDACRIAVQAEIDNAAMYDELFAVTDNQDITEAFKVLRDASQLAHLPAFQRCADRR